ncbi:MAG: glycosyltransferase family 4 protein [Candidatus Binatia bacterium]
MKVLHVHSGNLYGGVETILTSLVTFQRLAAGLDQHFALCFEGRLSKELTLLGAPVSMLGAVRASRPLSVYRARKKLAALLKRTRADVVIHHSTWSHALFATVARSAGARLVYWQHTAAGTTTWREVWSRMYPPDLMLCVSRFVAGSSGRLFPGARAEVYYAPCEAGRTTAEPSATRAALGAPPFTVVILQVARMEAWKGQTVLLNALSRLPPSASQWVCWMAGGAQRAAEQRYVDELKAEAVRAGIADRVRFLGERSDVPDLLAAADIVCQPNTMAEGFSRALVEALYAARPIVTSDLGPSGEVLDASCGVLVPAGNAARLAEALEALIGDPSRRVWLGGAGPARARELCAPETQMPRLVELLQGAGA